MTSSLDPMRNHIIIDGLPGNITAEKRDPFLKLLRSKISTKMGVTQDLYVVTFITNFESGLVDGAFVEFARRSDADKAVELLHLLPLTRMETLKVYPWSSFAAVQRAKEVYQEPELDEEASMVDLTNNADMDPEARVSYFVKGGPTYDVEWYWWDWKRDVAQLYRKPSAVKDDTLGQWTEMDRRNKKLTPPMKVDRRDKLLPCWSTFGTFLITLHPEGVKLWAGKAMNLVMFVQQVDVHAIQMSPNEQYLVLKSIQDVALWSIKHAKRLISLHGLDIDVDKSWPVLKFNADDTLCAVPTDKKQATGVTSHRLNVYETATMNLIPGTPRPSGYTIEIPGLKQMEWSPVHPNTLAMVVADGSNGWRVDICHVIVDYDEQEVACRRTAVLVTLDPLIRRSFLSAKDLSFVWNQAGTHAAAKVTVLSKNGNETIEYCLFRVGQVLIAAEQLVIRGSAERFAFQPNGTYFAVIVRTKSALQIEMYNVDAKQGVQLLGTYPTLGSSLFWSPQNSRIVAVNFEKSSIELFSIDAKHNIRVYPKREHTFITDCEWDPSGRVVVTFNSSAKQSSDNRYILADLNGKILKDEKIEKLSHVSFRPLSKSVLQPEEVVAIRQRLPQIVQQWEDINRLLEAEKLEIRRKELEEKGKKYIKRMFDIEAESLKRRNFEVRQELRESTPSMRKMRAIMEGLECKVTKQVTTEEFILEEKLLPAQ